MKKIWISVIGLLLALCLPINVKAANITEICLENELMHEYTQNVVYSDNDYSKSFMGDYIDTKKLSDKPLPVVISLQKKQSAKGYKIIYSDNITYKNAKEILLDTYVPEYHLYNLMPGKVYFIKTVYIDSFGKQYTIKRESIRTTGNVRAINLDGVKNVRDIGNKTSSLGGTVVMGRIYRGAKIDDISEDGLKELVNNLGVTVEIDFRGNKELGLDTTDTSDDYIPKLDEYYNVSIGAFSAVTPKGSKKYGQVFKIILEDLKAGKNIYIHCVAGADRTGLVSAMLEGVLGVSENDICKDYELTSFSRYYRMRCFDEKYVSQDYKYSDAIAIIKSLPGVTFADKWASFLMLCGVSLEEIEEFREIMLIK